jgi:hypothetical protein
MLVSNASISLLAAAAVSLAVITADLIRGRTLKMLPVGSTAIFAGLGCYVTLVDSSWNGHTVRIIVDSGLLVIALASLAIRLPFTLQYAREQVDADIAGTPGFLRTNYILTLAWTLAFVAMLTADILAVYAPSMPLWVGLAIAFSARNSAVYFTKWYAQYRRKRYNALDVAPKA